MSAIIIGGNECMGRKYVDQIFNVMANPTLVVKFILRWFSWALILNRNLQALVQKSEFPNPIR